MARRLSRRSVARYAGDQLLAGVAVSEIMTLLAAYLVTEKQTKHAGLIIRDIEEYVAERGHVGATVTSAFALSEETLSELREYIAQHTQATDISLRNEVDEKVLGGVKISLPGKELDQTIATQLTALKTRFKKA